MIIAPSHGFVLLSLPKVASTSLDAALERYHETPPARRQPPKHQNVRAFHQTTVRKVERLGFGRDAYELVCLFREPVAWLESWWRYRQRDHTRENRSERFTGDIAFDDFAELFLTDKERTGISGRPAQFVAGDPEQGWRIDRIFALDRPDVWTAWFSEQVGAPVEVTRRNQASARRPPELDADLRARLEAWFEPEREILDHLAGTGSWQPPHGWTPSGLPADDD